MQILLWEQRTKQNLTLLELSKITGVSKTQINAIENGKVSPRLDTLESLAVGLGVDIYELYISNRTKTGK